MREDEFIQRYSAVQQHIKAPTSLIEQTQAAMKRTAVDKKPKRSHWYKYKYWRRSIAACLIVIIALFGVLVLWQADNTSANPMFAVKAYAEALNQPFEQQEDIIVFPIDTKSAKYEGVGSSGNLYTGILFTLEGEGIERMQATLSRGELYAYESEEFLKSDFPEKATELSTWKPTLVGSGTYYGAWDRVVQLDGKNNHIEDDYARARMMKRLGSTIDVAIEPNKTNCWGLWLDVETNEVDLNKNGNEAIGAFDFAAMNGQTLTVTVEFSDGRMQTQVIELHDGWFATTSVYDGLDVSSDSAGTNVNSDFDSADNIIDTLPVGAPLSAEAAREKRDEIYTLYGKVISTANVPHPYSLESANKYANVLAPNPNAIEQYLEKQDPTITIEDAPSVERMRSATDKLPFNAYVFDGTKEYEKETTLNVTNISAYATQQLPKEFDLYKDSEIFSFFGNIDYLNRCRALTNGWTISGSGQIDSNNSFVIVEYDLLNLTDSEIQVIGAAGNVCAVDEENKLTTFARGGLFAACDSGWHNPDNEFDRALRNIHIKPEEAIHVKVAFIADNTVANAQNVFYVPSVNERVLNLYEGTYDFSQLDFVSFGKLERR